MDDSSAARERMRLYANLPDFSSDFGVEWLGEEGWVEEDQAEDPPRLDESVLSAFQASGQGNPPGRSLPPGFVTPTMSGTLATPQLTQRGRSPQHRAIVGVAIAIAASGLLAVALRWDLIPGLAGVRPGSGITIDTMSSRSDMPDREKMLENILSEESKLPIAERVSEVIALRPKLNVSTLELTKSVERAMGDAPQEQKDRLTLAIFKSLVLQRGGDPSKER